MLHSFGLRFKPWTEYAQIIRSEISRRFKAPIDFHDHSLLTARLDDDQSDRPFVNYLRSLYAKKAPDLIVAIGAPAANFVQRYRESIFPGVPMLFTVVEARRVQYDKLTRDDTVVATAHDFPAAFESILHVLPRTKLIAIVNGASPNERFWLGELKRETAFLAERVELKFYNELSFEQILGDASKLPPHSAIFFHLMNVDAAGVDHETQSALKRLVEASSAPIFSQGDGSFGEGLVGGPMHSIREGSEVAAAVAVRILNGEQAGDIKTPPTRFALPRFDWNQMQRWGISESRLPPGSEILFREPTAWERYTWQIALTIAVILLQAGLIAGLLSEHRRRQLAEVQSRQRMTELAHVNRFSTAGELTASIAHEINQPLGAILTNTETAQAILKSPNPNINELNEILGDILKDDQRATEVIRRMRSLLKKAPFELKNFDLNEVVEETIRFFSALAVSRNFKMANVLTQNALPILGDRIQLQQVILNLVVNGIDAMKDTPDENRIITIRTSRVENFAQLTVSDRGSGIPEDKLKEVFEPFFTSKPEGMGMGLSIARTIIEAHNGQISARNRDHGGATFQIRLPLCTDSAGPS
ncbi:ATP-binding protein [Bradyrhizobium sp. GCM10028915]|uniref:sensor histidine kinase n=1 Tax=Bradyrhizobium sp. GCM10028915 TaxID=3273385 RepID=UPI00361F49AC